VFADDVLPVYDVSDEVATVVDAEPQIWEALMDADLAWLDPARRTTGPVHNGAAPRESRRSQ
jgi:hypothetical protein